MRREPPLYRVSAQNEIKILRELDGRFGTVKVRFSYRCIDSLVHSCALGKFVEDGEEPKSAGAMCDTWNSVSDKLL